MRSPLLVIAAVAVGWIGWIGHPLAFAIAVLFPALWAASSNRWTAASISAGYFLAASRGLPLGAANFYETDMGLGLLLWLVAAAGFVLVHTALWTADRGLQRPVRFLIAVILMAVPPFGIVGWAHQITAAGSLFPGWGWVGVAAAIAILAAMTTRWVWLGGGIATTAFVVSAATYVPVQPLPGWRGLDTTVGGSSVVAPFLDPDKQQELLGQVRSAASEGSRVIVLPESAAGIWTPTVARVWHDTAGEATLLVGATALRPAGYDNVMVAVSGSDDTVVYRQRMPIPISMWMPWAAWFGQPIGASASFFGDPVVEVAGSKVAVLICYEQLLVWPVLQSLLHDPEILVATGNGWWTEGTSIIPIQKATVEAWARLFGVPVVARLQSLKLGRRKMDIELIKQCADERLTPAIVEKFVEAVGAAPLSVKVTIEGKAVLLPKIESAIQAADIVAAYIGKADVRFGAVQVPAGVGQATAAAIDETLFQPCKNLSLGTEIFAGIYEAVGEGEPGHADAMFEAAIVAYGAGSQTPETRPTAKGPIKPASTEDDNPHRAGTRIDLSSLGPLDQDAGGLRRLADVLTSMLTSDPATLGPAADSPESKSNLPGADVQRMPIMVLAAHPDT